MNCRNCNDPLSLTVMDFGSQPPSNALLTREMLDQPEVYYPLRVKVCTKCWLVQTEEYPKAQELFNKDYPYFSSYASNDEHIKKHVDNLVRRFKLNYKKYVVEVAANDGYLLQYIKKKKIPCLGIEPTDTAKKASEQGIDMIQDFFTTSLANKLLERGMQADLMIANNVLAHVPNLYDFIQGFSILLKPDGVAVFEFGSLVDLIDGVHFDLMYHEHYSYLSLTVAVDLFKQHGLRVFDVEHLDQQGGSLRVYVCKDDRPVSLHVDEMLQMEEIKGICKQDYYKDFQEKVNNEVYNKIVALITMKANGKMIVGYGAAAKANTLLNYIGIKSNIISFIVDRNPEKQGKFMPGSHIPIVDESYIRKYKPDFVIVFPWNIRDEVVEQLSYVKEWGGRLL